MRTSRFRFPSLVPLLAVLALAGAGCGGGDSGDAASAGTDVDELLTQTFTGSKEVKSGNLDLSLKLDSQGGDSEVDGPVNLRLTGPFQTQDGGKLPKFALEAAFEGAGQSINAGATSTGEKGYVAFQGTDYVVADQIFQQFKAGFEQAQKDATAGKDSQSFASLGMDPRKWLTDPKNEGEAKVGDADTIRITGGIDVAKLLDDVNVALAKASSLGLQGAGELPEKLTEAQRRSVIEAVKDPRVEIYTGTEDKILRRMVLTMGIEDSGTTGNVALDVAIMDLNEDQEIAEPADAKPFDDLLSQFGGLGALGGASAGGTSGGGSEADLEEYSECVTDAGEDVQKARECADLLAG